MEATAEEFGRDWDLVQNEIYRFAGEESYIPPVVIHWANIHPVVAEEMVKRGTRCYSQNLRPRVMGGPSLADRQKGGDMNAVEKRSARGADRQINQEAYQLHYGISEDMDYVKSHGGYYDPLIGLFFFAASGCCCNLTPLAEIPKIYAEKFAIAKKNGFENLGAASHEQYTFPYYPNYLPDHMARLECASRCLYEGGCKPVFYNDGILGNTAWD